VHAFVGGASLVIALVLTAFGLGAAIVNLRTGRAVWARSAQGALLGAALSVIVASLALWSALLGSDFRIIYVAQVTDVALPTLYKFAAFWSGFSGSLLLWTLILSVYAAFTVLRPRPRSRVFMPVVSTVFLGVLLFFLFVLNFFSSPFATTAQPVLDGAGLDPLLQYPEMAIHPVLLYLGFVGMTVPYAFGMAALSLGREGRDWLHLTRKTTLVAWLFLSAGIVMGAHWSYRVLGWGGYWAWDPVENAALLPWLTSTAFLHSAVIQEKRGMMRGWNVILVLSTFLLTIFGTFLTRSGVVSSIHAFTDSTVWPAFLVFLGIAVLISVWVILRGWSGVEEKPIPTQVVSKESSFLFNNVLLIGAAVAVFWGTIFPLVTTGVLGRPLSPGTSFFDDTFGPIMLTVVALLGICPVIPWRQAAVGQILKNLAPSLVVGLLAGTGALLGGAGVLIAVAFGAVAMALTTMLVEFARQVSYRHRWRRAPWVQAILGVFGQNRRRYGGYVVHVGILLMVLGVVGSQAMSVRRTITLRPGETKPVAGYAFTLDRLSRGLDGPYPARWADVRVTSAGTGQPIAELRPEEVSYPALALPMGHPDIYSTALTDVYVVLAGTEGESATLMVILNPLVSWIWVGALVLILGTAVALGYRAPPFQAVGAVPLERAEWVG